MNDNNENNENNNNDLNSFIANYGGATLGGIIALILCFTQIYRLLVGVVIILAGMFLGNRSEERRVGKECRL